MMSVAIVLHLLSATIWVGGMFFAHMILRPNAAKLLDPPIRLDLWKNIFKQFFPWVWVAIIVLFTSGYWMAFKLYQSIQHFPYHINIMMGITILLTTIFIFLYFSPFSKLKIHLESSNIPEAAKQLAKIRQLMTTNLLLGLIVIIIGSGGRYF